MLFSSLDINNKLFYWSRMSAHICFFLLSFIVWFAKIQLVMSSDDMDKDWKIARYFPFFSIVFRCRQVLDISIGFCIVVEIDLRQSSSLFFFYYVSFIWIRIRNRLIKTNNIRDRKEIRMKEKYELIEKLIQHLNLAMAVLVRMVAASL